MSPEKIHRIIYIEDDPDMIDLVSLILSRRGYSVQGADGGVKGLDLVLSELPDLVLLDLMMPDLDGWDVYQQMKAQTKTRNIPVIVITAKAQAIDRVLGLRIAKVDDYICKPFSPNELIASIDRIIEKNHFQA
jgi:two-component system, OmpR family, response regulator VicR